MLVVHVHTIDDALHGPGGAQEAARILRWIADKLEDEPDYTPYRTVIDINGNDVGRWKYAPGESIAIMREAIADSVIARRKYEGRR